MRFYADPCEVLERAEERTCKGCTNERLYHIADCILICGKGKRHGRRCGLYVER